MTSKERYKALLEKYYLAYSRGETRFAKLMKQVNMLNRHYFRYIGVVLLSLVVCGVANARNIDTIIIHHTGETNYDVSAEQIDRHHRVDRLWRAIGYHYVIRRNGNIERGRPIEMTGAHAKGRNITSIGVALSGNTATVAQLGSLNLLLQGLTSEYHITSIERHHEQCPGPSVPVEVYQKQFLK